MLECLKKFLQKLKNLVIINIQEILSIARALMMGAIGVLGFVLSCYEGSIKYNFLSVLGMLCIMFFCSCLASFIFVCYWNKNNTVYKHGSTIVNVCYGDLFNTAFNDTSNKVVVIPVNTAFDTIVDKSLCKFPSNLVSPNTIHGKFIEKLIKHGLKIEEIDQRIEDFLKLKSIHPVIELPLEYKSRGKRKIYEQGTVSVIEFKNTYFFLLCLSTFDNNNNAQCTKDQFVYALQRLIVFCDRYSQGRPIYLPLMGTNLSRADMSHKESLQTMVALFKIYANRLHNKVNIVIYSGDRDKVSIYDAK